MKTKKLPIFLAVFMCAFMGVLFSACGPATVKEIFVKEGTINTIVEHNSTFSLDGIVVMAKLSDGKEVEISAEECEFSTINTAVVGEQTLTISYGIYTTEIKINVVKKLTTISVKDGTIANTVDHNGTLDLSNAVIVLTYSYGAPVEIAYGESGLTFGNVDTSTVGSHKALKITYNGLECYHYYDVEKVLTAIEVTGEWEQRVPFKGTFVTTGITAKATYSDNSTSNIPNNQLNISVLGTQDKSNIKQDNVVTVTYQNKTANINVEIYAVLQRIEYLSGLSNQVKYNTDLDTSNLKVTAYYNDDSSKEISQGIIVTGYNKQTLGDQELTLSYSDSSVSSPIETTKTINVYEELEAIEIQHKDPTDATTGYALINEELDTTKFNVVAVYSKNRVTLNNLPAEYAKVEFSQVDTSGIGDKLLTISYEGKEKQITVHVVESWSDVQGLVVDTISILDSSVADEVDHNASLDISKLQIVVTYTNSLMATLDYADHTAEGEEQIVVTNIDTTTTGTKYLIATYKSKQAQKQIEVKRTLVSIEVKADTKVDSIKYGTKLDLSKVVIVATYSNGETAEVSNVANNSNSFDNTNLSSQTITFSYSEQSVNSGLITKECNMDVTVYEEIESLVGIANVTTEIEYGLVYNTQPITAKVEYTSGRQVDLENASLIFSTIDTSKLGKQTLTISYTNNGKTISKNFEVIVYDILTSIAIKSGVASTVYVGQTLDVSSLVLTLYYKSGTTRDIIEGYNVTNISTDEEGDQTLVVEYQTLRTEKVIKVIKNYTIIGYNDPTFAIAYRTNSSIQNTFNTTGSKGVKGFTELNNEYVVGDDNAFVYQPIMQIKNLDNSTEELTEFKASIKVYLYSLETSAYVLLEEDLETYVTVDYITHTFQFTATAVGKKFKIEVLPYSVSEAEQDKVSASVFEFRVIDGYNAYTAKDISLFDNANVNGKWTEYKTANNIALDVNISALILHNNISITDADIPAIHFLTEAEVSTSDSDYSRAVGSLKDSTKDDLGFIYKRVLASGETFTFEGNYFTLSAQDLSLIVRQEKSGVLTPVGEGEALTVHTALFGFFGSTTNQNLSNYLLNNISLFGNTKKTDTTELSGGVIFMKTGHTNLTVYNNLSQCWFISYFFENNSNYDLTAVYTLEKVNSFDAYNTMIYCWGTYNLNIINSVLIGAGGPIMICDHVDNNQTTGEGGYITNVKVSSSILESYVAGSEGWFATYTGSGALASQIKAFSPLFENMGKTLCDTSGSKINLVAVYKSGSAEGLTNSTIRGSYEIEGRTSKLDISSDSKLLEFGKATGLFDAVTYKVYKTAYDQAISAGADEAAAQVQAQTYCASEDGVQKINANTISAVKQFAEKGMFMQTDSGAVAFPGTEGDWYKDSTYNFDGTPDADLLAQTTNSIYIYLPNGMAAVLGIFDYSTTQA